MSDIIGPRQDLIDCNNAAIRAQRIAEKHAFHDALWEQSNPTLLHSTHDGSTHWIGDDGYEGCWREHRACAEARVARLEAALRRALESLEEWTLWSVDHVEIDEARGILRAALTNIGNQE